MLNWWINFEKCKYVYVCKFGFLWIKALQNWDFFELAEQYETGQFWEGSETRFPKPKPNLGVRKLAKGLKTCQISPKTHKIGFRLRELDFGAFPKPASFLFCGFRRSKTLWNPKGLSCLNNLQDPTLNTLTFRIRNIMRLIETSHYITLARNTKRTGNFRLQMST